MNRNHRRYNRNQPPNQSNRTNFLPPTPPVNNSTQTENSHGENNNRRNNHPTPSENKKAWQYADTIAVLALFVGAVMAVVTYNLFNISQDQVQSVKDAGNAAKASAIIAQNTLDETKAFNKKTIDNQREADEKADKSNEKIRADAKDYNEKLLSAQRDVLNETRKDAIKKDYRDSSTFAENKKEFEIENSPFLEIINPSISPVVKNTPIVVRFSYYNHGKLPAQVTICKSEIEYSPFDFAKENPTPNYAQVKTDFYIANGVSQQLYTRLDSLDAKKVKEYEDGFAYLFLRGYCEYINPVTKKKFRFYFRQRFNNKPIPGIESISNSVVPID